MILVREIEEGDRILFNDRSWPAIAESGAYHVDEKVGAIRVVWRVDLEGPEGADITLERTSTGRIRVSPGKYAPPENVNRLVRL